MTLCFHLDESPLRHIFQEQITDLILVNNDTHKMKKSTENYTLNVYAHVLNLFPRLKHLTVVEKLHTAYPYLTLCYLPSTTFSSSTLTHLCINVYTLNDCLHLLDGRLIQLNTFIVQIYDMQNSSLINHNMVGSNK